MQCLDQKQAYQWQNIISICYMPCLNPLSHPSPGSPSQQVPGLGPSGLPRRRARAWGDRGSTGTGKLATAIKLMSCIGQGTLQWQLGLGLGPGTQSHGHCDSERDRPLATGAPPGRHSSLAAPAPGPSRASGTDESREHRNFINIVQYW